MSATILPSRDSPSSITLTPFQLPAKDALVNGYSNPYQLTPKILIAPAGTGKTYALAMALKELQDRGRLTSSTGMVNICWLTTKSVKVQSSRVLTQVGVKGFIIENYATLRSTMGEVFIDWINKLEYGTLAEQPHWRPEDKPDIIVCDECQLVKNPSAQQSQVLRAAIESNIPILFASATPFTTIADAKILCMGLRLCTEDTWPQFSSAFCAAGKRPDEISPQGVKNLIEYLERKDRVVRFHNIKFAHRSINHCELIDFDTTEKLVLYEQAYEEYLEECRKANKHSPEGIRKIWVAILKFRKKAEYLRANQLALYGKRLQAQTDRQIIIASNFVGTLRLVWKTLVKELGVDPDKISFIVGGQNEKERQRNIDKFQRGTADYCLFTLKSGGAGISLHHDRTSTRPRHCILPPTWSAIELVQALGRAHRINSLSTTHQDIIWYRGTIEERVAEKVASRFSCLGEIVGKKEAWVNVFTQVSEEDASKVSDILNARLSPKDKETGEEIIFPAEAFSNES